MYSPMAITRVQQSSWQQTHPKKVRSIQNRNMSAGIPVSHTLIPFKHLANRVQPHGQKLMLLLHLRTCVQQVVCPQREASSWWLACYWAGACAADFLALSRRHRLHGSCGLLIEHNFQRRNNPHVLQKSRTCEQARILGDSAISMW